MHRTLSATIAKSTWPKPPALPTYPSSFGRQQQSWTVNIPELLLMIGYLTTPSHASGVSLSEFWAWVRYLHAVSQDADLRLTRAFSEIDSHQKTILSDDFGMGIPVFWLVKKLGITSVVDGRYFIDRVAASLGVSKPQKKKRGPSKSPDFVMRDTSGIWHILECKGTQSGTGYRKTQLASAELQKKIIKFPPGHSGQRLASGVYLGIEGSPHSSSVRIVDPEGDPLLDLTVDQLDQAEEALARATVSKMLRQSGFPAMSAFISAPSGAAPSTRPTTGKREELRRQTVSEKRARLAQESDALSARQVFEFGGRKFRGRVIDIPLPAPVWTGLRFAIAVTIRSGTEISFLDFLRNQTVAIDESEENRWRVGEIDVPMKIEGDTQGGSLEVGGNFVTDIQFRF